MRTFRTKVGQLARIVESEEHSGMYLIEAVNSGRINGLSKIGLFKTEEMAEEFVDNFLKPFPTKK
ncbi:MAG: hypothetical protein NUV80_00845 [Candidatus Berkelbacteria bacterium]|nr:hypothetical protein [Candidatus Berkelbacteria bacterium]